LRRRRRADRMRGRLLRRKRSSAPDQPAERVSRCADVAHPSGCAAVSRRGAVVRSGRERQ
jgi:hypothetical protein